MLVAIIEKKNSITQIYLENENNKYKLSGFCINDGEFNKVNTQVLDIFKYFVLGNNKEQVSSIDDYQTILDKDTGFYHFFKNGQEDFLKFCSYNGKIVTLHDKRKSNDRMTIKDMFRITLASIGTFIKLSPLMLTMLVLEYNLQLPSDKVLDIPSSISQAFDTISNIQIVSSNKIQNYIDTSQKIDDITKEFLWNEKLIDDVLPCYDILFGFISKNRHNNIAVVDYTKDEKESAQSDGYYVYDEILHVRDFDSTKLLQDKDSQEVLAHEYIHLLQTYTPLLLVKEASATIIANEYYMNKSDLYGMSYNNDVKYLKILMEIIGPKAVWDENFCYDSTAIEDAIKPFLSEEETKEFLNILEKHPYYNKDDLETLYLRLEELLGTLCQNKLNCSLEEDEMINALLNENEINRPYFNETLINNEPSYYTTKEMETISFEEAEENNMEDYFIDLYVELSNYPVLDLFYEETNRSFMEAISSTYNEETKEWFFTLETGEFLTGTIFETDTYKWPITILVPDELYKENADNFGVYKYLRDRKWSKDDENKIYYIMVDKKVYVPSIIEKFEYLEENTNTR